MDNLRDDMPLTSLIPPSLLPVDGTAPVFGQPPSLVIGGVRASDNQNSLLPLRSSQTSVGNAEVMEIHFLSAGGTSQNVPHTPTGLTSPNTEGVQLYDVANTMDVAMIGGKMTQRTRGEPMLRCSVCFQKSYSLYVCSNCH